MCPCLTDMWLSVNEHAHMLKCTWVDLVHFSQCWKEKTGERGSNSYLISYLTKTNLNKSQAKLAENIYCCQSRLMQWGTSLPRGAPPHPFGVRPSTPAVSQAGGMPRPSPLGCLSAVAPAPQRLALLCSLKPLHFCFLPSSSSQFFSFQETIL